MTPIRSSPARRRLNSPSLTVLRQNAVQAPCGCTEERRCRRRPPFYQFCLECTSCLGELARMHRRYPSAQRHVSPSAPGLRRQARAPLLLPLLRYALSYTCKKTAAVLIALTKSFINSRATLASVTLFTAGSIAWYTTLYGTLPFVGEVHASSAADEGLHPPQYPWSHSGWLDSFDHARSVL